MSAMMLKGIVKISKNGLSKRNGDYVELKMTCQALYGYIRRNHYFKIYTFPFLFLLDR